MNTRSDAALSDWTETSARMPCVDEGVLLLDMQGHIISINPALEKMTGIPAGETINHDVRGLLPELLSPADAVIAENALDEAKNGQIPKLPPLTVLRRTGISIPVIPSVAFVYGPSCQPMKIVVTLRDMLKAFTAHPELRCNNDNENVCKDGRRVWVHWANQGARDEGGKLVEILCVGADITKRKELGAAATRYQERLQELAERIAASEEEERWRISRYIHDTIIQNLSLSIIKLGALRDSLTKAKMDDEVSKLNATRALMAQAVAECRSVMADLTPALLYDLGLILSAVSVSDGRTGDFDQAV